MPCRSLFRKALPGKPVASVDAHTAMVIAQLMGPHAASVASQITGLSNVEALGRGTVSTGRSPSPGRPQNRTETLQCNKPNKGRGRGREGNVKQKSTPKGQAVAVAEEEENPSRHTH